MAPGDDVSLRLARDFEAAEIAALSRDCIEQGLVWSWTPERVLVSIREPDTNVLVARDGERLAGFGIMSYGRTDAHLQLFAVHPEQRRQGLGRRLLEWLEKPAVIGGLSVIWLEVRAGNTGAILFYERLGYRRLAELPRYYQGRETAVRMGRELGHGAGRGAQSVAEDIP